MRIWQYAVRELFWYGIWFGKDSFGIMGNVQFHYLVWFTLSAWTLLWYLLKTFILFDVQSALGHTKNSWDLTTEFIHSIHITRFTITAKVHNTDEDSLHTIQPSGQNVEPDGNIGKS